jgi:hypothetical protein
MVHVLVWRRDMPCVVSFLGVAEVGCEVFAEVTAALMRLFELQGRGAQSGAWR